MPPKKVRVLLSKSRVGYGRTRIGGVAEQSLNVKNNGGWIGRHFFDCCVCGRKGVFCVVGWKKSSFDLICGRSEVSHVEEGRKDEKENGIGSGIGVEMEAKELSEPPSLPPRPSVVAL